MSMFQRYPYRSGSDWLCRIPEEDRKVFGEFGYASAALQEVNLPQLGGKARAALARRIPKGQPGAGRFVSKEAE